MNEENRSVLDPSSLMEASTAISGEVVLGDLLRTLMSLVFESTLAQRGVLLLARGGRLVVEAEGGVDRATEVAVEAPKDGHLATSIVRHVARTRQHLVLDAGEEPETFGHDPYFRHRRPRSILCLPLGHDGSLTGVLYLEHLETPGAFGAEPIELLRLLSAQVAVSIDNALLFENLEEKVRQRAADVARERENVERALGRLEAAQAQLVHAEKMASLGEMTAGIAHEIKNPLNFVNNLAELTAELCGELREALPPGSACRDGIDEILAHITTSSGHILRHGQRADAIIRAMMQHTASGPGRREPVALNALVEEQLDFVFHSQRARGRRRLDVELEKHLDPDVGLVPAAGPELARVLVNLLQNAFDAVGAKMEEETGDYQPRIRILTRRLEGSAEIRVEDNGPGIPESVAERIFEPFFSSKPNGGGNAGLGLSISYDIVTRGHGGRLVLDTAVAQGASLVVTLPLESAGGQTA